MNHHNMYATNAVFDIFYVFKLWN